MGKSSLLRHLQREFHHPEHERYAWVEDLKSVAVAQDSPPPHTLWQKLRDGCKSVGLVAQRVTTDQPEEIARHIAEALRAAPERQLLVLCDEADSFLEADAKDGFRAVEGLCKLMADTQRHFKVVFAGSHNVQRFHNLPHQPLAPFGEPVIVGPLEPDAARKLVSEPFVTLGYRFADEATVLRILSYTNYQPALIQLFCRELLNRLQERADEDTPPYPVTPSAVEEVYRSRSVQDGIREQLDSTLALDPCYQALIWTMLLEQQKAGGGYAHPHTPNAVWQVMQQRWPRGMNSVSEDQVRALLDELCGLGVLVRTADGRYGLRNPNLVPFLGTDVEDRLLKLSQG
jgi:hypothetical protein